MEHNIKINAKEIRQASLDWIRPAMDGDKWRDLVIMVMNLQVPWNTLDLLD